MGITWQDKWTNDSVFVEADSCITEAIIAHRQLQWSGHVVRMPDMLLPKQIFYTQLRTRMRSYGGQRKCYRFVLKNTLVKCGIDADTWDRQVKDRVTWRTTIKKVPDTLRSSDVSMKKIREPDVRSIPRPTSVPVETETSLPECSLPELA